MPQERKKNLEYILAHYLDLPKDLLLDLPRVTLVGDMQLTVENHRGIIEYTAERVRIATSCGQLGVNGEGLTLKNIDPEEIVVEGKISGITLSE